MALTEKLTAVANSIRAKTGKEGLLTLEEMPAEIDALEIAEPLPEEALLLTNSCQAKFKDGGWDWFIDKYGDQIATKDITDMSSMFEKSLVENIPFELNAKTGTEVSLNNIFNGCQNLKTLPKINNLKAGSIQYPIVDCYYLREIPDDYCDGWDWSSYTNNTSSYFGSYGFFKNCYSLRKFDHRLLTINPKAVWNYSYFYRSSFYNCYVLDELVNLPVGYTGSAWQQNVFSDCFWCCWRLKRLTFETNADGTPKKVNWKNQQIDLIYAGYPRSNADRTPLITGYNSGITADKAVSDDISYQLLKNDPDWYCSLTYDQGSANYSRYDHDSAVETINSLPDTSEYLATAGGTNTIKFQSTAGGKTDGGAISTLTAEEIAVATSKGWTVTFNKN